MSLPTTPANKPGKHWPQPARISPAAEAALSGYNPLVQQLLFNRGFETAIEAKKFLEAQPPEADAPELIQGLPETVERIERAIVRGETIRVYGDYDTDGVTATALLVQVLSALDARVEPYIPNRLDEGYGLNNAALSDLKSGGCGLVITVDCGIRSLAEAEHARSIGLDLIITDHHTPGQSLPDALAVIDPKRDDETYAYRDFAGVGLAYKIAQALVRARKDPPLTGSDVLDLVALGTVSDLAPLTGENRTLVRRGLAVINKPRREGLKSLIQAARLRPGAIDAGNIGFALGPRLNAAGRLESAMAAYDLLTATDVFQAGQLAGQLESQNRERQELTKTITEAAREQVLRVGGDLPNFLFAAHADFNPGVVGLAAARLSEEFYRPAAVASVGAADTRGSARSIREFHITQALDANRHLLVRHGGHAAAAGFTVLNENAAELADGLRRYADEQLAGRDLRPVQRYDAPAQLQDLTFEFAKFLKQFEPCGYGNPAPAFAVFGVEPKGARAIGDGTHLRLTLSDGKRNVGAIAFRQAHWLEHLPGRVDAIFGLEINEWQGELSVQLNVKDMRPSA
jgi:single-stranded-DNA-specific exonuclease